MSLKESNSGRGITENKEILKQLGDIPEDIYDEIVHGFYEETRERLKLISEYISSLNWSAIARAAHGIKGSSANLRLFEIQAIAEGLQGAAESNDPDMVKKLADQLKPLIPD